MSEELEFDLEKQIVRLQKENNALREQLEVAEDAIAKVDNWTRAYPIEVFPEPDFQRVRELLKAGGITLDSVSASNMRHVIEGVKEIIQEAKAEITKIGAEK